MGGSGGESVYFSCSFFSLPALFFSFLSFVLPPVFFLPSSLYSLSFSLSYLFPPSSRSSLFPLLFVLPPPFLLSSLIYYLSFPSSYLLPVSLLPLPLYSFSSPLSFVLPSLCLSSLVYVMSFFEFHWFMEGSSGRGGERLTWWLDGVGDKMWRCKP